MIQSRIREIRKEKGLTLQEVAERAGTTAQTIGRLETGRRTLSLSWVNRISQALGVEGSSLLALPEEGDIEICGVVGEKGEILNQTQGTVSTRLFAAKPLALKIKANLGAYQSGDILIFEQKEGERTQALGKECLVHLKTGERVFALVLQIGRDSRATFIPLGKKSMVQKDKSVVSVSPLVALIRPLI